MTRRELLARAQKILTDHDIPEPSLEAELLLRHALKIDRVHLLADTGLVVSSGAERFFLKIVDHRIKGEPAAYITGQREFYGLDFEVNSWVLIPRPETELLVEKTIEIAQKYTTPLIADIGTGSGAVAATLAYHLPQAKIYAIDISERALIVARRNSQKHGVEKRITYLQGNLLEPLAPQVNIIVANLPYIRTGDLTSVNTWGFEPLAALDGGADGLNKIRELCLEAKNKLLPDGCILLEIGLGQSKPLAEFVKTNRISSDTVFYNDLNGIERVARIQFG